MSLFVVDASLVVKWFVPEVGSDDALRWLNSAHEFIAPDLLLPEAANAVWKKVRRDEVDAENGRQLVADIARAAVESVAARALLPDAFAIALNADITVYDAMYVALAARLDTEVISGDDRLIRKLAGHPMLRARVRSVSDFGE